MTRRLFLIASLALLSTTLRVRRALGLGRWWRIRPAQAGDAGALAAAWEQTRRAGRFPEVAPRAMDEAGAGALLRECPASVCVEMDGRAVAFVALEDWGLPGSGALAQTEDPRGPQVRVLVACVADLRAAERVRAVELAMIGAARELLRRGYRRAWFVIGSHNRALFEVGRRYTGTGRVARRYRRPGDRADVFEVHADLAAADRNVRRQDPEALGFEAP